MWEERWAATWEFVEAIEKEKFVGVLGMIEGISRQTWMPS